ncbi:MAG TPA: arsenate reductase ArsC [Nitrospira sp.]|nr:arsenate reductase ArsC [Nitrospira sp.]
MAEVLLHHLAGDRYDVLSAGTHPVGLNPVAVAVMQELGIDMSAYRSKHMGEFRDQPFDYVMTVCDRAKESCLCWPHMGNLIHWSFEDPAVTIGTSEAQRHAFIQCGIKSRPVSRNSFPLASRSSDASNLPSHHRMGLAPARIIHEHFYCTRRSAAVTSLAAVCQRPGEQARPS